MVSNTKVSILGVICSIIVLGMIYAMENTTGLAEDQEKEQIVQPEMAIEDQNFTEQTESVENIESEQHSSEVGQLPLEEVQHSSSQENVPSFPTPPTAEPVPDTTAIQPADNFGVPTASTMDLIVKESPHELVENEPMSKEVRIGVAQDARTQVAAALQKLLADEYLLFTKTLNFHWNVEGKFFGSLHELFNKQYEQLLGVIDSVAERMRALGVFAQATMKEFLSMSTLSELPNTFPDDTTMITLLLADHEAVIQTIRTANELAVKLNDAGTNNFLSHLLEIHEKIAWMLRAHLNR